ncbi:hypothetical protein JCM9534A_65770 [Catenuloplanes indicus JCM 9534]
MVIDVFDVDRCREHGCREREGRNGHRENGRCRGRAAGVSEGGHGAQAPMWWDGRTATPAQGRGRRRSVRVPARLTRAGAVNGLDQASVSVSTAA